MLAINDQNRAFYKRLINILSIAIPVAVAVLLNPRVPKISIGTWTQYLPHVNGMINSATSVLLIAGFIFIKQKKINLHRTSMLLAFVFGSVFLVTYVLYHASNESTPFGGTGVIRYVYYFLLITHILFSLLVVRGVLLALYYALGGEYEAHKRIVKWTYPIWLYVSVTGVIVYLMIAPYYS